MKEQEKHEILKQASRTVVVEPTGFFGMNVKQFELLQDTGEGRNVPPVTEETKVVGGTIRTPTPLTYSVRGPVQNIGGIEHNWQLSQLVAEAVSWVNDLANFSIEQELMRVYSNACGIRTVMSGSFPCPDGIDLGLYPTMQVGWPNLDYLYDHFKDRLPKEHGLPIDADGKPVLTMVGGYNSFDPLEVDAGSRAVGCGNYSGWKFKTVQFPARHSMVDGKWVRNHPFTDLLGGAAVELDVNYNVAPSEDLIVFHPDVIHVTDSLFRWELNWVSCPPEKDAVGNLTNMGYWLATVTYTPKVVRPDLGAVIRVARVAEALPECPGSEEPLAHGMYRRYCLAVGGRAFNGDPLPSPEEFFNDESKQTQARAWVAAADYASIRLATGVVDTVKFDSTFAGALNYLKEGFALQRSGWNGKGMFVYMVPANSYPAQTGIAKAHFGEGAMVPYGAYLAIKGADGVVNTWVPSISDIFANDWSPVALTK